MQIKAIDPATGKAVSTEAAVRSIDEIRDLLEFDLSEAALKRKLDKLAISADAKSILFTVAKTTIRVGSAIVQLGRKVLDVIIKLLAEFPNATKGAVFGGIFGALVSAIPIIGTLFGPLITPLAIAFGFVNGVWEDLGDKALARRVAAEVAMFNGLKP